MIALLNSELRRLLSRPLFRLAALAMLAGVLVGGLITFASTSSMSESSYQSKISAEMQRCVARGVVPPQGGPRQNSPEFCRRWAREGISDPRLHLAKAHDRLEYAVAPLVIFGWLIGASSVGGEWQSRGMTSLLTYESRRMRVFLAKLLASGWLVFGGAVLAMVAWLGAILPSLYAHGGAEAITGSWYGEQIQAVLRAGVLAVFGMALAFSLAFVGRSTAFALGVGFAYVVVAENVIASGLPGWRRWLLLGNAIVFAEGKDNAPPIDHRTVLQAAIFLGVVALTLVVGAYGAFRQQEVT